jgi:hypothetical protein
MTKKILFFPLTFLFLMSLESCEVEEIIPLEDTYVEYTVVQAELHPDEKFPGVRFTKTLPLGVLFDIKQAELKNISVYIKINGVQVVPLHYTVDGLYKPLYDFYISAGESYELFAENGETYIYASTKIPNSPSASNFRYNTSSFYLSSDVAAEPDIVYAALWIVNSVPQQKANDFYTISLPETQQNQILEVRTSTIPVEYRSAQYNDLRAIQVFAFDESFRNYFKSRTASQDVNNPFIQGGGSVDWNVQGEKVIGMFIGVTPGNIINVN